MTTPYVWVVTKLLPLGVPTVTRYRLLRRTPGGGAWTLQYGRKVQVRPTAGRSLFFDGPAAGECVRAAVERVRQRIEDIQRQLELAARVHDCPAEGHTGPLRITEDVL